MRRPVAGPALVAATFVALACLPRPSLASPLNAVPALSAYMREVEPKIAPSDSFITIKLCHPTTTGKCGDSFYTPFGLALRGHTGCPIDDPDDSAVREKFKAAYAAVESQRIDSDCDGYPDFDEIRAGKSPNTTFDHPSGEPSLPVGCVSGGAGAGGTSAGGTGDDGSGGDDPGGEAGDGGSGGKGGTGNEITPKPTVNDGGGCAVSSTGRPLDLSALLFTALVALPMTRRALRPRRRR